MEFQLMILLSCFFINVSADGWIDWFPSSIARYQTNEGATPKPGIVDNIAKQVSKLKDKPINQLYVETGVPAPVEEPPNQVTKIVPEPKWTDICEISFDKHDILMVTFIQRSPGHPEKAFPPILLDPRGVKLSFRVANGKKLAADKALIKSLALFKFKKMVKLPPLHFQLDSKTLSLLPKPTSSDLFILTIIKSKNGSPKRIASHFVDTLSVPSKY